MENKNYYEWLEISTNASQEIIEKAYKTLVKKYHPDLQDNSSKQESEEIMKHITEAYSVLSNAEKRAKYDLTLTNNTVSKDDYDKLQQELNNMKTQAQNRVQETSSQHNPNTSTYNQHNMSPEEYNQNLYEEQIKQKEAELQYREQMERAKQKAYRDAYIQDLKNRGYKIRYKKTLKDYIRVFLTIIVIIVIFLLLWIIPFTRNWFINLYNNNEIIKATADIFINIINAFLDLLKS